jgi:hypothetical protein
LQISSAQAAFLFGDNGGPSSARSVVQVTTANPNPIDWTATVSPPVTWLSVEPPGAGTASASSAAQFTLVAARPAALGTYTATVVVAGTTSSGGRISPMTVAVRLSYSKDLYRNYLPNIFKHSAP